MITLGELTNLAVTDGVDARTVERDYIISHVMGSIAVGAARELVQFKGGTAIRLCYESAYRYSADIDLNVLAADGLDAALIAIEEALDHCRLRIELPHLSLNGDRSEIEYIGPTNASGRSIKLDLTTDEYIDRYDYRAPILGRYSDQTTSAELLVYAKGEILAEKFRCVLQRLQCRDLYDIWWLTGNDPPDIAESGLLFAEKARHRGLDPALFPTRFETRTTQYRERWSDELPSYLSRPPDFDRVLREVRRVLRQSDLI